jgi:hypothetical protein
VIFVVNPVTRFSATKGLARFNSALPKVFSSTADPLVMSVNPISSSQASQANEAAKPAAPKPQQTQQKSSAQPSDTVTLKSTGTASQTGDNH